MANRKKSLSHKKQKIYKMKGCSKNTRKKYLGGSTNTLASSSSNVDISKAYPTMGPNPSGFNFLNPQTQKGGGCGGTCGLTNPMMTGGKHRTACKCSNCRRKQRGGSGNNGIPYPDGLVGSAWTPSISTWPGVNGVSGDSNYLKLNTYTPIDISRQMVSTGAQPPFLGGKRGTRKNRSKQKAGGLSNFLYQDLVNVGREFQYGIGTTYNALRGYESPVNPLPWKGQLSSNNSSILNILK